MTRYQMVSQFMVMQVSDNKLNDHTALIKCLPSNQSRVKLQKSLSTSDGIQIKNMAEGLGGEETLERKGNEKEKEEEMPLLELLTE